MKTIKLITKSEFFKESQFSIGDFYGKQTIIFSYTEREFVDRSLMYHLFSDDLKPLPSGFDSVAVVNKCHIEETDKEFIITIDLVTAKSVWNK